VPSNSPETSPLYIMVIILAIAIIAAAVILACSSRYQHFEKRTEFGETPMVFDRWTGTVTPADPQ